MLASQRTPASVPLPPHGSAHPTSLARRFLRGPPATWQPRVPHSCTLAVVQLAGLVRAAHDIERLVAQVVELVIEQHDGMGLVSRAPRGMRCRRSTRPAATAWSETLDVDVGRADCDPGAEPVGSIYDEHDVAEGGGRPGGLDTEEPAEWPAAVGGGSSEGHD